jgi:transcriptional regulator with XRE-family HTH domain
MESFLSSRVKAARLARNWTLDAFARASGVSRAMISKIERGEVSPTAAVLARLAAGLDVSLASLFVDDEAGRGPLSRGADQTAWTDPDTGYTRRNVSPPGARGGAEIVDVTMPAGARVVFDNLPASPALTQQVWLLSGALDMTVGEDVTRLAPGDCLFMRLDRPLAFRNPGSEPARYAVVLARAPTGGG